MNNMKTLVLHPDDPTTKVLEKAYEGKDWKIITNVRTSKHIIKQAIKDHDRIIMLGHGSPSGLLKKTSKFGYSFMIDPSYLQLLRGKILIAVWCNADQFFKRYDLNGFYTGMIISEESEAEFENIEATLEEITYSNELLSEALRVSIDSDDMLASMKDIYVGETDVMNYNKIRLYYE